MGTEARVIADTITVDGHRLTTLEVTLHRFVLAELNTHRAFSRNSASSRAIPLAKQLERVRNTPAIPVSWPAEQKGMQGGDELDPEPAYQAFTVWRAAGAGAVSAAERLGHLGVHKSVANRLLEPFMWHTVVVTATDWDGFWAQRCSPLAQPEIRVAAEAMRDAYRRSTPHLREEGEWHVPYVTDDEYASCEWPELVRVSAARCARVSYLTQDGVRDAREDLALYERLVSARPAHWSPLEHVATPWPHNVLRETLAFEDHAGDQRYVTVTRPRVGNLLGWRQLRFEMEAA